MGLRTDVGSPCRGLGLQSLPSTFTSSICWGPHSNLMAWPKLEPLLPVILENKKPRLKGREINVLSPRQLEQADSVLDIRSLLRISPLPSAGETESFFTSL